MRPHSLHVYDGSSLREGIKDGDVCFYVGQPEEIYPTLDWHYSPTGDYCRVEECDSYDEWTMRPATEQEAAHIRRIYAFFALTGSIADYPDFDL